MRCEIRGHREQARHRAVAFQSPDEPSRGIRGSELVAVRDGRMRTDLSKRKPFCGEREGVADGACQWRGFETRSPELGRTTLS